ncbi:MAG: signal peptidase I [Myxococcaceae bacterium]|nr:signal peptidase I [Myxococcaceae bacterium]
MGQAQGPSSQGRNIRLWRPPGWLVATVAFGALVLLLRGFVFEPRLIVSSSMAPTLLPGDRLVMDKLSYRFHLPRAGDIIVFALPPQALRAGEPRQPAALKRVIALPGQRVEIRDGQVLVDGQPLHEPYLEEAPRYTTGPIHVPEGMLFVLGDNRNASSDSHDWGLLPARNVRGRAWLRFWPTSRAGGL